MRYRDGVTHQDEEAPAAVGPVADDDAVMLIVHPALRRDLFAYLNMRGLDVGRAPFLEGGIGMPVFLTTPSDDRFKGNPVVGP